MLEIEGQILVIPVFDGNILKLLSTGMMYVGDETHVGL